MKLYEVLAVQESINIEKNQDVEVYITTASDDYYRKVPMNIRNMAILADFYVVGISPEYNSSTHKNKLIITIQEEPPHFSYDMDIYGEGKVKC